MYIVKCPKCGSDLNIYCKDGYYADLDIRRSNQNTICRNCRRKISYSVQKKTTK